MKSIQYLLLFFALTPLVVLRYGTKSSGKAIYRIGFILFFALISLSLLFPNSSTSVARFLGVGRGADLILYFTTLALICLSVILIIKFEGLEKNITRLAREIAVKSYSEPTKSEKEPWNSNN